MINGKDLVSMGAMGALAPAIFRENIALCTVKKISAILKKILILSTGNIKILKISLYITHKSL